MLQSVYNHRADAHDDPGTVPEVSEGTCSIYLLPWFTCAAVCKGRPPTKIERVSHMLQSVYNHRADAHDDPGTVPEVSEGTCSIYLLPWFTCAAVCKGRPPTKIERVSHMLQSVYKRGVPWISFSNALEMRERILDQLKEWITCAAADDS